MSRMKKFLDMTEDEAYEDYLKFCEENGFKLASKEQFLTYMDMLTTKEEDGDSDDE